MTNTTNTTRMVTVKNIEDLPSVFKDIVSFQVTDKKVEAITLTIDGVILRIVKDGSYSDHVKILTEEQDEVINVYNLSGSINGLTVNEDYEDMGKLNDRKYILESMMSITDGDLVITDGKKSKKNTKLS